MNNLREKAESVADRTIYMSNIAVADEAEAEFKAYADALELVLLFHRGGPWTEADSDHWQRITGNRDACTRSLCDHIRDTLGKEQGQ